MRILKDTDTIHFGKFIGEKLANVPDDYLFWLWEQPFIQNPQNEANAALKIYIKENLSAIMKNIKVLKK